ncbi:MAG: phosphatidylinositol mannoside acyltransferase [Candidatus Nanopelagicales bacterium]
MNIQDEVTYWVYATGWRIVRALPEKAAYGAFLRMGDQLWRRRGKGVRQLEKNLQRVVPDATEAELRELSREGMRSYMRYWCDAFRMPSWTPEEITHRHRAINDHYLADALAGGKGAVFAVPHGGNYDLTGAWASIHFAQVISVAERLKPERLYEEFLDYRRSVGMKILPHAGGEGVFEELVELVKANGLLALLADRDLSRHGVQVEFFGEAAKMPIGPAAICMLTGAPMFAASLYYTDYRAHVHVFPPVEPPTGDWTHHDRFDEEFLAAAREFTQRMADQLAEGISMHPTHWHMLQPVFLADLEPR